MRTIASLLCVILAGSLIGCSESSQRHAADKVRQQVDLACRHYVRALGLIVAPAGEATTAPAVQNNEALAALSEARTILNEAISTPDATNGAKEPAYRLLAQVQISTGEYYANLSSTYFRQVVRQLSQTDRYFAVAKAYASLSDFYEQLAKMDPTEIEQLKEKAQTQQAELSQAKQKLDTQLAALTEQVNQLAAENSQKSTAAGDLRNQSRGGSGQGSLDLLKRAIEIDRQVNLNNAKINELKSSQESLEDELKGVMQGLGSADMRLEAMTQRLASVNDLASRSKQQGAAQGQKAEELAARLQAAVAEVAAQFKLAAEANEQATSAYEQAARANQQAQAGLDELKNQARDVQQASPESSVDPILAALGGPAEQAAIKAQKGDIALATADLHRALLDSFQRVQNLRQEMEKAQSVAGKMPTALAEAIAAVKDVDAIKQSADQDYATAAESYDAAMRAAASAPKANGVDMKAVLWIYQGQKARALLGEYYLTGDKQKLADARALVDTILQENPENPYIEPIRQINQMMPAGT